MLILNITIVLLTLIISSALSFIKNDDKDIFTVNVTMKEYQSSRMDQIVYIPYRLPDEELSIIGYHPLVHMNTTHHMDTFACQTINSKESFWEGEDGVVCGIGEQMLVYGWDRDALPLQFPPGIGIAVGKNTPYKYLVVNIHYLPIVQNDCSGNQLILSRKRGEYLAGVMLAGSNHISLPSKRDNIKVPFSCEYHGTTLSIFAGGVHAHRWARVNSLYRVRDGKVTLIIKGDPQQTGRSYFLTSSIDIQNGDYLIGQCVYDNDDDRVITVGPSHENEMCNVMIGYSYKAKDQQIMNKSVPIQFCWENSVPHLISLIPSDSEIPPKRSSNTFENFFSNKKRNFYIISSIILAMILLTLFLILIIRYRSNQSWRFTKNCFKRKDGFEQLNQLSDEENQFL